MILGDKIRQIRELQSLSQGDIEARSGLLRCYISRVENGYTVPSLGTLEKIANALRVPLYRLFWEETDPQPTRTKNTNGDESADWAIHGTGQKKFRKLRKHLAKLSDRERALLLAFASTITRHPKAPRKSR